MKAIPLAVLLTASIVACAPSAGDDAESSEQEQVADITKMTARGDGTFDVTCRDGRQEIVSAEDVKNGAVCTPPVVPESPFSSTCKGAPMTEAIARARLGANDAVTIGTYNAALRHRDPDYRWDAQRQRWEAHYRWVNAPQDSVVAWRQTNQTETTGTRATFSDGGKMNGSIELSHDATGPYLRMIGQPVHIAGPDTTKFIRLVSAPLRPWNGTILRFDLEVSDGGGDGTWRPQTEWGWSVQVRYVGLGPVRNEGLAFGAFGQEGNDGQVAFVTSDCGQLISAQSLSNLSPVDSAMAIFFQL